MLPSLLVAFGVRCLLVILFLPFPAADKIRDVPGAVGRAREVAPSYWLARWLILTWSGPLGVDGIELLV